MERRAFAHYALTFCPFAFVMNRFTSENAFFGEYHYKCLHDLSHNKFLESSELSQPIKDYIASLNIMLTHSNKGYAYGTNYILPVKVKGLFSTTTAMMFIINNRGNIEHGFLDDKQTREFEDFVYSYLTGIKENEIDTNPVDFLLPRKLLKQDKHHVFSYSNELGNVIKLKSIGNKVKVFVL